jgi:N-methylhydantoinase A
MPEFTSEAIAHLARDFNIAHMTQYGHSMDDPVEIVTLRVSAIGMLPRPTLPTIAQGAGAPRAARKGTRAVYQAARDGYENYVVYDRGRLLAGDRIDGPAIVEEPSSTTVVHAGDVLTVGKYGELMIQIGGDQ